jgi:hypothetical protein
MAAFASQRLALAKKTAADEIVTGEYASVVCLITTKLEPRSNHIQTCGWLRIPQWRRYEPSSSVTSPSWMIFLHLLDQSLGQPKKVSFILGWKLLSRLGIARVCPVVIDSQSKNGVNHPAKHCTTWSFQEAGMLP